MASVHHIRHGCGVANVENVSSNLDVANCFLWDFVGLMCDPQDATIQMIPSAKICGDCWQIEKQ